MKTRRKDIEPITNTSFELVGSAAGGFIGASLAGPVGAMIGAVSGELLTKAFKNVGEEIQERFLGPREKHRIEKVIKYAAVKLKESHENGILINEQSDLLKPDILGRTPAEEILEAVLLVSQKSYEELKLKFIGNLYANIVVTPSMDRYQANLLLKLAEALSYRQFCLLRFFCLRQPQTKEYFTSDIVAAEVLDLQTKGIIHIPWHLGSDDHSNLIVLNEVKVNSVGFLLAEKMNLEEIHESDISDIKSFVKENIAPGE